MKTNSKSLLDTLFSFIFCPKCTNRFISPTPLAAYIRIKKSTSSCKLNSSLFGWLVADGWCWFVLGDEYCWLVAGGWFVVREKYCWLVADKPSEQGVHSQAPLCNRSWPTCSSEARNGAQGGCRCFFLFRLLGWVGAPMEAAGGRR
jgi:hypothetical protein